jgi:peptidoglycan/xylan/chitin deacetylase (PgdA/CDA1 family)
MTENAAFPWPNGARCAVAFTFDMDGESLLHIYQGDTAPNRIALTSMLRYGPLVAVPRIVEIFKRLEMRQTFFIPGWCIERYPQAVECILEGGHEIAHHSWIHENPNKLSRDEEAEFLGKGIDAIVKATGKRPRGYRAPSYAFSRNTLDLLLAEGFSYDASLLGGDIPYVIGCKAGEMVELPSDLTADDWMHFASIKDFGWQMPIVSPDRGFEVYRAEFDAAWKYGGLWIGVWHPFVSGRPSRCDAMVEMIEYMKRKGGVWFASLEEIAAHARICIDNGSWKPRREMLPYYDEPIQDVPWNRSIRGK